MGFGMDSGKPGGSKKKAVITIDPDGKINWDLKGFEDGSCKDVSKTLAKAFGGKIVSDKNKPEAHIPVKKEAQKKKMFGV